MDTEEAREIAHHQRIGHPETDEGPYYHESWWEGYKGGVKGLLGGLTVGGAVGTLIGGLVAAGLTLLAGVPLGFAGAAAVVAGFAALGAYHGASEFSEVGIVTGAVAASHEKSEARMKEFEDSRFAELKREIRGLKQAVTGNKTPEKENGSAAGMDGPDCQAVDARHQDYPTKHCNEEHCPPEWKLVFWKVAGIGLAVGAAAGALLAGTGLIDELLHPVIALAPGQELLTSMIVGGAVGASFGINRDLFRRVFDVTDHLFRGILPSNKSHAQERGVASAISDPAPQLTIAPAGTGSDEPTPRVLLISAEALKSSTFYKDAEAARRAALLALDHTQVRRPN